MRIRGFESRVSFELNCNCGAFLSTLVPTIDIKGCLPAIQKVQWQLVLNSRSLANLIGYNDSNDSSVRSNPLTSSDDHCVQKERDFEFYATVVTLTAVLPIHHQCSRLPILEPQEI